MYNQISARQARSFSPLAIEKAQEALFAAEREQSRPHESPHAPVIRKVVTDLMRRGEVGMVKYGSLLRPFNGRSQLLDLYQELLDAVCYCAALLYEEEHNSAQVEGRKSGASQG